MAVSPLTSPAVALAAPAVQPPAPPQNDAFDARRVSPSGEGQRADLTSRQRQPAGGESPTDDPLQGALTELNQKLDAWNTNLRFEIDDDTSRVVVQVVDAETGEVVRQIPSEEVMHMSKMLGKLHDLSFHSEA